jgi:tetratricopeptide (TPR) repeat protein
MARVALQEYCDQARELIDGHRYAEAIAICRHILKRYPRHIRTYQILGEACLENGELVEAIDIFKRLLANADPENLTAYAGLSVAYQEKGQLEEAIWYMERAFELAPNNEGTRNSLRQLYRQRDGVEPDRVRHSKAALARLYARGGQYRQAIEEFRHLLEAEEQRGRMDLKVSLAETLWRDGRREQAAELAREILQAAPDCLKAILLLGKITIEKGRTEEGKAILEQTRGLDPENRAAQALFGEASPLPPQVVLIPKMEPPAEAPVAAPTPTEIVVEPAAVAVAPAAEAVAPVAEISSQETTGAAVEPAPAAVVPPTEATAPVAEIAPQQTVEATEVPPVISEEAEPTPVAELPAAEAPAVTVEPVPTAIAQETVPAPVAEEPAAEEGTPGVAEPALLAGPAETAPVTVPEQVGEETPAVAVEPVVSPVEETAPPAPAEAAPPTEAQAGETPAAATEPVIAPIAAEAAPKKKRGKRAVPQATVLEAAASAAAGPLSDIERYQLLLEQKPKDDELRLALARAYRDGSQMKLALEQYAMLVRAKQKLLPDLIADVEGIVASRPDNLEAHELLADLYGKNGQLQKALERYRWVLQRLREGEKGN